LGNSQNCCSEVEEKTRETVVRGLRPRTTVSRVSSLPINSYSTASLEQQKGMSDLLSNFSKGDTSDATAVQEEFNNDLDGLDTVLQEIGK
jgi:hypothetical protein